MEYRTFSFSCRLRISRYVGIEYYFKFFLLLYLLTENEDDHRNIKTTASTGK